MSTMQTLAREEERLDTLESLASRLLAIQETKVDYVVDTRRMSAVEGRDGEGQLWFDAEDGSDPAGGPLTEHAHSQVALRLGIPKRYYERMRSDAMGLWCTNVEHWFHQEPERRMVRMLDGKVRALLSERYRRLDNIDLMEHAILPAMSRHAGDLQFQQAVVTDDRLYVRALLPRVSGTVQVGDVVQAGVAIRNSEVGKGRLEVAPFVWRLSCLNGMVAQAALSRYHVGRAAEEEAYALYRDDTLAADDAAFFLKVRDAIDAALDEVTFGQIVEQLRATIDGVQIADPVSATERLAATFDINDDERRSVLRHLAGGGDLTQWGMVNALTAAAKDAESFDRQEEMETLGYALANVGDDAWARIAG